MPLVTIDFHNTLFSCDAWFQLEIRDLPIATLDHLESSERIHANGDLRSRGVSIYRDIREEAVRSGIECDAVASMIRVAHELELGVHPGELEDSVRSVMHHTVTEARPLNGAVELVLGLQRQGFDLAVVSSAAYHPFLEWCLEKYGLSDSFQHVVSSAACGIYKSDPAIYRHTLDLFSTKPDDAVHIGDSHRYDVMSARSVGIRTILLAENVEVALDPPPDAIISALGDATKHLDRLLGRA